ncbi:MAG TPA: Wzz/FepE/Etk N-terminal domain-containing protein [Candidatus Angelobacter sp.]|nr:Wzz/FepE/Etk N-terminal domain-containing protein [Candidatus Angelobacter sp.]
MATTEQQKTADFPLRLAQENPGEEEKDLSLFDPLIVLAKRRVFIFKFVGVGMVLGAAIALLLPVRYSATIRIMPPQSGQSSALAMLGQLGQLAPLLGASGKDIGVRSSTDLYIYMLRSRTVADDLIQQFSLLQVYKKKMMKDARKRLESLTEITAGKEGGISISVEDSDPQRVADLANAYVRELQDLTRTLAVTEASRRRVFFEQEVQQARDDLSKAELDLKQTQLTTGVLQLDSQSKAMLEGFMTLRAQVAAKEAQVESMRSFATPENPDLLRAENELAALRSQLSRFERGEGGGTMGDVALEKVPAAGLEYLRKLREVKYREALFEMLAKQYEIARIDEAKDASIIQVLDPALRPEAQIRTWPIRLMIAALIILFSLAIAVILAFLAEKLERMQEHSQYFARMQVLKYHLSRRGKTDEMAG